MRYNAAQKMKKTPLLYPILPSEGLFQALRHPLPPARRYFLLFPSAPPRLWVEKYGSRERRGAEAQSIWQSDRIGTYLPLAPRLIANLLCNKMLEFARILPTPPFFFLLSPFPLHLCVQEHNSRKRRGAGQTIVPRR